MPHIPLLGICRNELDPLTQGFEPQDKRMCHSRREAAGAGCARAIPKIDPGRALYACTVKFEAAPVRQDGYLMPKWQQHHVWRVGELYVDERTTAT